uniref:Uncharacterized protein n=2 Tax=Kalanchoe fedtschenkoi TaxID=63787 RepID=A0A7N0VLE9_KALFE
MEELKKLEQVQKVLSLMQSHRITSSSRLPAPESDRFLSSLVLLLMQPCGELGFEEKCQLVCDNVPKLSTLFLEEVSASLLGKDKDKGLDMFPDKIKDICSLKADFNDEAMVGLDAMQRANSTLEDFCRSYFMFHDLDASKPQSIFRYLPILSFTESYIYQLDCLNESLLHEPVGSHNVLKEAAFVSASDDVTLPSTLVTCKRKSSSAGSVHAFLTDPFRQLVLLLQRHGLMTERIGEELRGGEEYWKLERQLCSAMINKEEISIQVVMRAIHLKSFDYRVLNLLLFNVRGEKVDNIFMDFLSASEFLVEVADDLFDYEDDVLENNFNILRMFVRIYGPSAAPTMLARCITEGEEKYIRLLHGLDPDLSHKYQVRCEEATREGGKGSGPPLGTWNIPTIITDEELYRSNISAMSP